MPVVLARQPADMVVWDVAIAKQHASLMPFTLILKQEYLR
jgi:hypothetical protein